MESQGDITEDEDESEKSETEFMEDDEHQATMHKLYHPQQRDHKTKYKVNFSKTDKKISPDLLRMSDSTEPPSFDHNKLHDISIPSIHPNHDHEIIRIPHIIDHGTGSLLSTSLHFDIADEDIDTTSDKFATGFIGDDITQNTHSNNDIDIDDEDDDDTQFYYDNDDHTQSEKQRENHIDDNNHKQDDNDHSDRTGAKTEDMTKKQTKTRKKQRRKTMTSTMSDSTATTTTTTTMTISTNGNKDRDDGDMSSLPLSSSQNSQNRVRKYREYRRKDPMNVVDVFSISNQDKPSSITISRTNSMGSMDNTKDITDDDNHNHNEDETIYVERKVPIIRRHISNEQSQQNVSHLFRKDYGQHPQPRYLSISISGSEQKSIDHGHESIMKEREKFSMSTNQISAKHSRYHYPTNSVKVGANLIAQSRASQIDKTLDDKKESKSKKKKKKKEEKQKQKQKENKQFE